MKIRHIVLKRWPFSKKRGAVTIYPVVFYKTEEKKVSDYDHEMVHIGQAQAEIDKTNLVYGWLKFHGSYIWKHVTRGYKNNKYEKEAVKAEKK